MLTEQERLALDAKLSGPFNRGDIIADVKGELIGVFNKVAYHGGSPEGKIFGNYIFADFQRAISKQGSKDWHVINTLCGDDDTYIDRRESDLTENYKFATNEQIELFNTLMANENNELFIYNIQS